MSKSTSTDPPELWDPVIVQHLKDRYECPNFRILIVGRANAGKTTILEKVCGVQQGTKPIIRRAPTPAPKTTKTSLLHRIFNRPKRTRAPASGGVSSSTESLEPSIYASSNVSSSSAEFLKPSIYVSLVLRPPSFKPNTTQTSSAGSTTSMMRLHMKGATSSSMILVESKQEQLRRWKLSGSSSINGQPSTLN